MISERQARNEIRPLGNFTERENVYTCIHTCMNVESWQWRITVRCRGVSICRLQAGLVRVPERRFKMVWKYVPSSPEILACPANQVNRKEMQKVNCDTITSTILTPFHKHVYPWSAQSLWGWTHAAAKNRVADLGISAEFFSGILLAHGPDPLKRSQWLCKFTGCLWKCGKASQLA